MYKHLERGGVHVAYGTAGEKLLTDRAGRVIGVRALEPDGYTDVKARGGVVVASGGFEANVEMRVRYLGRFMDNVILRGTRYNTGERFLDEGEDFRDQTYVKFSKAIMNHKSGVAFNVFDNKARAEDPDAWKRAIRTVEEPYEADTIRGLAEVIQVPPERMERTIQAYNAACQPGTCDP